MQKLSTTPKVHFSKNIQSLLLKGVIFTTNGCRKLKIIVLRNLKIQSGAHRVNFGWTAMVRAVFRFHSCLWLASPPWQLWLRIMGTVVFSLICPGQKHENIISEWLRVCVSICVLIPQSSESRHPTKPWWCFLFLTSDPISKNNKVRQWSYLI